MNISGVLLLGIGLLVASAAPQAQVSTHIQNTRINQGESLRVRYEANAAGWPDLSPLEQDFIIQGRNTQQSSRTINGRTSRRIVLSLSLLPKRSGELTLPALNFAGERSRSATITVKPSATTMEPESIDQPTALMPPSGYPALQPSPWYPAPSWSLPHGDTPEPVMESVPMSVEQTATPPAPAASAGHWPWLAGFAMGGWLLTGLWAWRQFRVATGPTEPKPREEKPVVHAAPPAVPRQSPTDALPAIEKAYRKKDAYAAKQALLHWASLRWPDDPPGNLGRLAARCPGNVQTQILKLENALYSPSGGGDWNHREIWSQLPMEAKSSAPTNT